jgi:hypothetical protein
VSAFVVDFEGGFQQKDSSDIRSQALMLLLTIDFSADQAVLSTEQLLLPSQLNADAKLHID